MSSNGRHARRREWVRTCFGDPDLWELTDEELLELRFCDLTLTIEGTPLAERIELLERELALKRMRFRPHFWLSEEWFTPDGVPGIAMPFYLADSRLMKLEETQMLEVEGGTPTWCMKILRHETGHAIDNAYRLRRRRRYREMFGNVSVPYPEAYTPRPYSRSYVVNIDMWYAQSHPVEDFAETFAVWLKPRSRWRQTYQNWPALKKLEYVNELMKEIRDEAPPVRSRRFIDPLSSLKMTLGEHYARKRAHYGLDSSHSFDHELRRLFCDDELRTELPTAASFLRRIRPRVRRQVAEWTGHFQYTIDQVLGEMIQRARELNLRLERPPEEVERDVLVVLTMHTMNYIQHGEQQIAL